MSDMNWCFVNEATYRAALADKRRLAGELRRWRVAAFVALGLAAGFAALAGWAMW